MEAALLIVAGGRGERMKADLPKQFMLLGDKPVLMHTLERVHDYLPAAPLILVLHADAVDTWQDLCQRHHFNIPHHITSGGRTRYHSVKKGLSYLKQHFPLKENTLIGIHDGVRPLIDRVTINQVFQMAAQHQVAVPVVESRDSLRMQTADGKNSSLPRQEVFAVQTPQVFRAEILLEAYDQPYQETFTDDASVIENSGYDVHLCAGHIQNIKITYPMDILLAEMLLQQTPS